ncbi:hypothetical protein LBMAG46_02690 [Planctomycetia bacterium]|nr:hypothetical protein LBMAG46_02690 [Planctomycetia bacterium]
MTAGATEAEGAEIPAVAASAASVECREACLVVLEADRQAVSAADLRADSVALAADLQADSAADLREDSAADLREDLSVSAVGHQVEVTVTVAVDSRP